MEDQTETIPERKKRAKRGVRKGAIGRKAKAHHYYKQSTDKSSCSVDVSDNSSIGDISTVGSSSVTTDTEVAIKEASTCEISLAQSHLCMHDDGFSDTTSEAFTEETEPEETAPRSKTVRRGQKSNLAYKTKHSRQEKQQASAEDLETDGNQANVSTDDSTSNIISAAIQDEPDPAPIDSPLDDNSQASQNAIELLKSQLILLLPSEWSVSAVGNFIRLVKLNEFENVAVHASIAWKLSDRSFMIFIHGRPLPEGNKIFHSVKAPEPGNIGSLADFFCKLTGQIDSAVLCPGIQEQKDLWDFRRGFIDCSSNDPCFRSFDCVLLLRSGKISLCSSCRIAADKFGREKKRKEAESTGPSTKPDMHCSAEELKDKKEYFKKMYQKEKRKGKRLESKVDKLQLKLDAALKDELTSILISNEHKMTAVQKLFWQSQREAMAKSDKRGLRWHPMLIRIALFLHSKSDASYRFWQDTGLLQLPSSRRLFDYSHFVASKKGCQEEIIKDIKKKIDAHGTEEHFSCVNLMFDEMHIRAGLVTNKSTGELVGFTDLTEAEEELIKMQNELTSKQYKPKLAKKILVYLIEGITSTSVKDVVAIYSTDELCALQLYNRTWEVIYNLEEASIKVLALTCDGASVNRKFFRMHLCADRASKIVYCTKNLYSGTSRKLFFFIDPPHLLKTVRNCLANSFSHRKTRQLWKNGEHLSWKVFEHLYNSTKQDKFRGHKLTHAHVKLTSFSCMTVSYAAQCLSESVANCIEKLKFPEEMGEVQTDELVKFIRLMNKLFDCLNGKEEEHSEDIIVNPYRAAYRSASDPRLDFLEHEFLQYFEDWKDDIENRPGLHTDKEKNGMIISHQSLEALDITVKSFVGVTKYLLNDFKVDKVNARVFNQDPIEQYFSKLRRQQGDNKQPTLHASLSTRLNLHAQGHVSMPSKKGTTSVQKRKGLEVDSAPLPSRKTQRKSSDK